MWAEKWTIMQEACGSSTAPNAARRMVLFPVTKRFIDQKLVIYICSNNQYSYNLTSNLGSVYKRMHNKIVSTWCHQQAFQMTL